MRNGCETVLANSGNRTATNTSNNFSRTQSCKGVQFVIDITTVSGFSLTFTIQGYDPVSQKSFSILVSAAKTVATTFTLTVYPGATAAANVAVSAPMPAAFNVLVTHSDATPVAYSVSAHMIP